MASLSQFGAFIMLISIVGGWLLVFAGLGALCAKARDVSVALGGLYGALFGPLGVIAALTFPRRLLGDPTATHGRLSAVAIHRGSRTTNEDDPFD